MRTAVARAMMSLATRSLGEARCDWAHAMHGEFRSAIEDGRPLAFAAGCLIAAWRELPSQEQGRFTLVNHILALGLLIPMAVFQLECVAGLPYFSIGPAGLYAMLTPDGPQGPFLIDAYPSAVPVVVALWLLLGTGHLGLAWFLLERDWPRIIRTACLMVAASATLVIFTIVLFLDDSGVQLQAGLLGVEVGAIYALARWHRRAFLEPGHASPA